jgi:hypothetical protein
VEKGSAGNQDKSCIWFIFLNGGFFIFVLFYTFYTFNKLFVVFDVIPYFVAHVDLHINVYEKKS